MPLSSFISDISTASVLIPIGFSVGQWRKMPKDLSPLKWILVASLICDVLMYLTGKYFRNSYPAGNTYLLLQFLILLYMFSFHHKSRHTAMIIGISYLMFYIIDVIYLESFLKVTTIATVISSLIVITLSLHYLYKLLSELTVVHIHRFPMLWVIFAFLLYYSCTLFILLANNYLLKNIAHSQSNMWVVHNFFNITKNILFAVALWKNYQIVRSSTSL